jgi:hypothetical protein
MLYVDFLDSVQSAFPSEYYSEKHWWRPKSIEQQKQASQIAHAAIILRILHGETLVLSNNQAFDSVAWLQAAEKIGTQSDFSFPPMIWAAHGVKQKRLTPHIFLAKVIETFENPGFKLSAWVGIDDKLRLKIVKNLIKHKSFEYMLDNMQADIADDNVWDWLSAYANGLESFYKYLQNSRARFRQNLIIRTAPQVQNYIWPHLQVLKDQVDGIPGKVLDEVRSFVKHSEKQKNITGLLEIRGELYDAFQEVDDRDEYKKFVDLFYNEKIALSCNGGQGIFSIQDHNPLTPPEDDEEKSNLADKFHGSQGLIGKTSVSIEFNPTSFPELNELPLADCFKLLSDYEFQNSIRNLRRNWRQYPSNSTNDPEYFHKYQTWSRRTHEVLVKHQALLARKLESKIAIQDDAIFARIKAPFAAGTVAAAGELTATIMQVPLLGKLALKFTEGFASELLTEVTENKVNEKEIPASASGRIRRRLYTATSENYFYNTQRNSKRRLGEK